MKTKKTLEHKAKMVRKSIERESLRRGIVECRKGMQDPLVDNVHFFPAKTVEQTVEGKTTPPDGDQS